MRKKVEGHKQIVWIAAAGVVFLGIVIFLIIFFFSPHEKAEVPIEATRAFKVEGNTVEATYKGKDRSEGLIH